MTMKKYTHEEIQEIIKKHQLWFENEEGGEKANFEGVCLEGANFKEAYLKEANFEKAYLKGANFKGAFLKDANFKGAHLEGVYFEGAFLTGVNFDDVLININTIYYNIQINGKQWIKVGCQEHSLEQWLNFKEQEIKEMSDDALEFYPILIRYLKTTFNLD